MKLERLRHIGALLVREIALLPKRRGEGQGDLGKGAAGDKTYPIDRLAEEIIISGLESSGEPLTIISEEAGVVELNGGGKKVLIDPVDGSRNAVAGIPFYCTSIAVADGDTLGDIELAYVINLINGDEFHAAKGGGSFLGGERITPEKEDALKLVAYETQVPGTDLAKIIPLLTASRKTRCFGATALDLAYLACGAVSVFVTPSLSRSFDFAAGWLLVREAGGIITDIKGDSIDALPLGLKRASTLLASGNPRLHEKAKGLIA